MKSFDTMIEHSLNIMGGEWIIIIFVALILFLGTGQLPGAARKLGRAVNEFNRAKEDVQKQLKETSQDSVQISGPVENERQKNEIIAKSLGIRTEGKTDLELQKLIEGRIGQKEINDSENKK